MGGAAAASSSSASGRTVGSRAGRFLSGLASVGLDQTLDELSLRHLVGADRYEVVTALVDYLLAMEIVGMQPLPGTPHVTLSMRSSEMFQIMKI